MKAEATFKHMYIYNPLERRMERLCALEDYKTDESYCSNAGTLLDDNEKAFHLALGNINPFTLKRLDNWHPDQITAPPGKHVKRTNHKSIWQSNFKSKELPEVKGEKTQSKCALFFKKVDFVGQTIDAEIEANYRQEQAKHTEAELNSMYSFGVKRKRSPSQSSCNSTPPSSPAQCKSRHNPFAKDLQRSPVVCKNGSLLRLLSPNKNSPNKSTENQSRPGTTRVNAIKRSIFPKEQVEVRSRFFGTQTKSEIEPREVESKINEPEIAQVQQVESAEGPTESKTFAETNNNEEIVLLSSCDSDDSCSRTATLPSSQEAALPVKTIQKLPPSARRVGLSKPKTSKRSIPTTKTVKSDENQTRLSMFGFQKRPALK